MARLAELDRLHGQLSGPATKKLAERAATVYDYPAFQTLAGISVAHLYNLRASLGYQRQRGHHEPTRPRHIAIGERRRRQPNGEPSYLRVDSVHQGDWDGIKGLYVINLVDAVTQFAVVVAVERISENFLIPALQQALEAFPSSSVASTPTTARSTSTTAAPRCSTSCASSSPSRAPDAATTTH